MTGRPEAKDVEVTAIADKKAKLRVVNIYGEEQKAAARSRRGELLNDWLLMVMKDNNP